jgi:hypothetical protein
VDLDEKWGDAEQPILSPQKQMTRLPPGSGTGRATIFQAREELVGKEGVFGTDAGIPVLQRYLMDRVNSLNEG